VILIAIALSALSYVLFAHASTLALLIISRMLTGVGSGNITAAQAYITDITPADQRARSLGLIGAAFGLGFIFGPPLGSLIFDRLGVEWVGYTAALLCLLNLAAVWLFLPESLKEKVGHRKLHIKPVSGAIRALAEPRFRDLYIISFVYVTAFSMMQMTIAMFWYDDYGLDKTRIGYMFAIVGLGSAIVQGTMVGWLQRTFGERNLMVYGALMVAVGLGMIAFIPRDLFLPMSILSIALLSLGNGCLSPTLLAQLSRSAKQEEQGEVLGVNQSFGSLARIAGPAMGGRLYEVMHGLPYITAGVIMLVGLYYVRHHLQHRPHHASAVSP
jgi:predicted MFS family arabinose efflux permease